MLRRLDVDAHHRDVLQQPPAPSYRRPVAIPLAVLAVAFALWWLTDQLVRNGVIDRMPLGYIFILPLIAGPTVAALAWRRLEPEDAVVAAGLMAAPLGVAAGAFFAFAVAAGAASCQFGTRLDTFHLVLAGVICGVIVGLGYPLAGLSVRASLNAASAVAGAGGPIVAALSVLGGGVAALAIPLLVGITELSAVLGVGVCNRPV